MSVSLHNVLPQDESTHLVLRRNNSKIIRDEQRKKEIRLRIALTLRSILYVIILIFAIFVVISSSFILSVLFGQSVLRESKTNSLNYVERTIQNGLIEVSSGLTLLTKIPTIINYVCNSRSLYNTVNDLVFEYADIHKKHHMHHIRIIEDSGMEIIRVDINHTNYPLKKEVQPLYNMSERSYHIDFLDGKSINQTYFSRWTTHGPLPNGFNYTYVGSDIDGDHNLDHEEYFPLPSLVKAQRSVICPNGESKAYIIANIRMVISLKIIQEEMTNSFFGDTYVIDVTTGDYIYNSVDRDKEFQSELAKTQTLQADFGMEDVSSESLLELEYFFSMKKGLFLVCNRFYGGDYPYLACNSYSYFDCITASPFSLVIGVCILMVCFLLLFGSSSLLVNYRMRKERNKFKNFSMSVYPREISKRVLSFNEGDMFMADELENVGIIFADLVNFTVFSQTLNPETLISFLGALYNIVDEIALAFKVSKIKLVGDCYLAITGLGEEFQTLQKKKLDHIAEGFYFCCYIAKILKGRYLKINGMDIKCPSFRVGYHVGCPIGGILGKNMPLYDVIGTDVNYASRLESSGLPNMVHISQNLKNELRKFKGIKFKERDVSLKGFKEHEKTYFAEVVDFSKIANKKGLEMYSINIEDSSFLSDFSDNIDDSDEYVSKNIDKVTIIHNSLDNFDDPEKISEETIY